MNMMVKEEEYNTVTGTKKYKDIKMEDLLKRLKLNQKSSAIIKIPSTK